MWVPSPYKIYVPEMIESASRITAASFLANAVKACHRARTMRTPSSALDISG
jgi:hypothetical protein